MTRTPRGVLLQSLIYAGSGINHFWHRGFYVAIMPDHYSRKDALVCLSGAAEIVLGLGLLPPATRRVSAFGIGVMLIVFLDVHQFMLRHPERFAAIPKWVLWGRLALQPLLIAWAWRYLAKGPRRSMTSGAD